MNLSRSNMVMRGAVLAMAGAALLATGCAGPGFGRKHRVSQRAAADDFAAEQRLLAQPLALAAERRVLARCADPDVAVPTCSSTLIASATRRAEILEQLVQLGIEDANAHPEASSLAYHNATRQVSLSVR